MTKLYPLRFQPEFRRYLWGGRRLATELGKPLPPGDDYAESWEVVDHGLDQSRVANGALAGQTLHEIIERDAQDLYGLSPAFSSFPLLFKFLDACQNLSIQVHPNDEQAAKLPRPDAGKTEAWVVMAVSPGSRLYAGLKPGIGPQDLQRHLEAGTIVDAMHVLQPQVGDCIFVPAGVVHAIGKGLLIAEIQQASDTTFRIYDWGRVDATGKPRTTHLLEALSVTDFACGPIFPQIPVSVGTHRESLVRCDKFCLDRWRPRQSDTLMSIDKFQILTVLRGEVRLSLDPPLQPLRKGDTVLMPACLPHTKLEAQIETETLIMYLP